MFRASSVIPANKVFKPNCHRCPDGRSTNIAIQVNAAAISISITMSTTGAQSATFIEQVPLADTWFHVYSNLTCYHKCKVQEYLPRTREKRFLVHESYLKWRCCIGGKKYFQSIAESKKTVEPYSHWRNCRAPT